MIDVIFVKIVSFTIPRVLICEKCRPLKRDFSSHTCKHVYRKTQERPGFNHIIIILGEIPLTIRTV